MYIIIVNYPDVIPKFINIVIVIIISGNIILPLIPKFLQIIGMFGWSYEGLSIYRDRRWQGHGIKFIKASIVWILGIFLDIILRQNSNFIS